MIRWINIQVFNFNGIGTEINPFARVGFKPITHIAVTAPFSASGTELSMSHPPLAMVSHINIQHLEGGIIREVRLREGERVRAGDDAVQALGPVERQAGALFLVGNRVVGFDLFDRAVTLRQATLAGEEDAGDRIWPPQRRAATHPTAE